MHILDSLLVCLVLVVIAPECRDKDWMVLALCKLSDVRPYTWDGYGPLNERI